MGQPLSIYDDGGYKEVGYERPLPVTATIGPTFNGVPITADYIMRAAAMGNTYIASDAAAGDTVTGQTSLATTTPMILLQVPSGRVAIPWFINLSQTGSVANAAFNVLIEIDKRARYSNGGTSEKIFNPSLNSANQSACSVYTGATAIAGYGIQIWGATIANDVSPAEGAVQGPFWKPEMPYLLEGPASLLVYAYVGTTAPTFLWSLGWAEYSTTTGL